MYHTKYI